MKGGSVARDHDLFDHQDVAVGSRQSSLGTPYERHSVGTLVGTYLGT